MLTVKKAAEALGISTALVYGLCARGKLAHERYGLGRGTIRVSEAALAEYRERARVMGTPIVNAVTLRSAPPLKHLTLSPVSPARASRKGPG